MSNASKVGTSAHSLGEAIERLRGKWAAITAFGVLLVVFVFAALVFSLVVGMAQQLGLQSVPWLGLPAVMIVLWSFGLILYSWRDR